MNPCKFCNTKASHITGTIRFYLCGTFSKSNSEFKQSELCKAREEICNMKSVIREVVDVRMKPYTDKQYGKSELKKLL